MYIYKHTGCPTKITPCLEGRSKQGVIFLGHPVCKYVCINTNSVNV